MALNRCAIAAEAGACRRGVTKGESVDSNTHRVAISNRRLVAADDGGVSFRWKDYRIEGPGRWKTMTLTPHEFIRRFLIHVLPKGLPSHPTNQIDKITIFQFPSI
jgi:hypothetical protein